MFPNRAHDALCEEKMQLMQEYHRLREIYVIAAHELTKKSGVVL
jgi:hypothetical protein